MRASCKVLLKQYSKCCPINTFHWEGTNTHSQLLFDVFNCGLQSPGPLCGFILHCLHRLKEGRDVGHHHLQRSGSIRNDMVQQMTYYWQRVLLLALAVLVFWDAPPAIFFANPNFWLLFFLSLIYRFRFPFSFFLRSITNTYTHISVICL